MLRNLLLVGLVAGLCGGVVATGFAAVAGEPAVDAAIAYEAAHAATPHDHGGQAAPAVARSLQKSAGLLTALAVYGLAVGGIFALVFAFVYGRVGRASPRTTAYWLAGAALVTVFLVPFVKYPATPPGAGAPQTIGERTALYVTMIAISVLAAVAAARLRLVLARRGDAHAATLGALLAYAAVVVAAALALPGINEIPRDFPATALWRFREATLGLHAVMWLTIGPLFAYGAHRVMTGQPLRPRGVLRPTTR